MGRLTSISDYLRAYGAELGTRVLNQFPALHQPGDAAWPGLAQLKRQPFPAQKLAIMGIVKKWETARCAAIVVTFSKSWPKRSHFGLIGAGHIMV